MLKITENIEEKIECYKDWYKQLDTLVNQHFNTTPQFESSVIIGQTIQFDIENPELPDGVTIPEDSVITIKKLAGNILEIKGKTIKGNLTIFSAGIRSIRQGD